MLRHRYFSSSNLSDGRNLENRGRFVSDGSQQEMQKYSHTHFHRPAVLPRTEQARVNRNPPLLMVKPIKRYEENDCMQNTRSDIKVWLSHDYYNNNWRSRIELGANFP